MHKRKRDIPDPLIKMGYEEEHLHFKSIWRSVMLFFTFVTLTYVAALGIFWWYNREALAQKEVKEPFTRHAPAPPNPLLQTNITAKTDIQALRQGETEQLNTAAILDKSKGIYRIPVARAIDLVTPRLPVAKDAKPYGGAR
ncbi:MAG: hypothetical protein HY248_01320 [Fimbriimonas ginsengisoli]|uniref:Uncharacterized protein n=1 Tax=Fimbriimonas ginsengisoli TaxID=1005039 RepID=A0A931LSS8_FIMGI|nr:hypothetical protein [Fimbriimonas ginsengisoli]MBI3721166.1 hypothetical protein [Fimbriimonas ginsengisoli]